MSFPRYLKYKPSGVEWLGEVPEGWTVRPLKTVASHNDDTLDETTHSDTEILYVDISGVDALDGIKTKEPMLFGAAPSRARRRVKHGDTIVSTVRTYLRAIGRVRNPEENLIVSTGFAVIRPQADLSADYIGYILSAGYFIEQVIARSTGVSYPAINASELVRIAVALPQLPEQTAIAEFLDRETGKIDELVAEQRRLMELLKEKRQAVISHAVTKGLNPHAPIKPSGVKWLGDVPSHWEVWKLTHAFKKIGSGTTPKTDNRDYYEDGNNPWVITGDLNDGYLSDCEKKITDIALNDHSTLKVYPAGSVVIAMYGATIGKLAILKFPASVNQACCVFSGMLRIECKFLFYWLLAYRPQIISLASGGGQPNINQDILRELRVACPDLNEQNAIVDFLDSELAKFDALTTEAQRAIDLLQERRTALISAAVTGQIDVRQQKTP